MSKLPLTSRDPAEALALRRGEVLTVGHFLDQARVLAEKLPSAARLINLCHDRYAFSVVFAAALMAGRTTLLPGNRLVGTIDQLIAGYPGALAICDRSIPKLSHPCLNPEQALEHTGQLEEVPVIDADFPAAAVFTSGSTGAASAIDKPWRTLHDSSLINAAETGPHESPRNTVATVPPQHMWGLETSVLMPWFAPVIMSASQPFYVTDILAELERLPTPRALISTPIHLRALVNSGQALPELDRIYSATAPLSADLARRLEMRFGAEVVEIYGCSETGCLARRRTAWESRWRLFDAFSLTENDNGHHAYADHLPEGYPLMDRLVFEGSRCFRLVGRHSDLVNIAGKRSSLAGLTEQLLEIPGVHDGVIFQPPEQAEDSVTRLAALVVAPDLSAVEIRQALGERIDPAFMPRPLRLVEHLPRAESGKLPRQALFDLYQQVAVVGL